MKLQVADMNSLYIFLDNVSHESIYAYITTIARGVISTPHAWYLLFWEIQITTHLRRWFTSLHWSKSQ